MRYAWKVAGLFPVDADTAAREIERIKGERDGISAAELVDASREEGAPLHGCFEWDDSIAAERYRNDQAKAIMRGIVVESVGEPDKADGVRAFVHVQSTYQPLEVVIRDADKRGELLAQAMRDMESFKRKYEMIEQVKPVIDAIDGLSI